MSAALVIGNERVVLSPAPAPGYPTGAQWGDVIGTTSAPIGGAIGLVAGPATLGGEPVSPAQGITVTSGGSEIHLDHFTGGEFGCHSSYDYDPAGPRVPAYTEAVEYFDSDSCIAQGNYAATFFLRYTIDNGPEQEFFISSDDASERSFHVYPSLAVSINRTDASWGSVKARFGNH